MLPSNDSINEGKQLIAQLGFSSIAEGYLPPASTSSQSDSDQDTSRKWVSQFTNLPGTSPLGINSLAAASAPVSDAIPVTGSTTSLQESTVPDCCDFVDSDDEYDVEEKSEAPERYAFGRLYCPIRIGQVLDQIYRVEHKLGHGAFSTVWMAHDITMNKDVALKIMVSGDDAEYELSMQNKIMQTVQDTSRLLTYKDTLVIRGYHGDHRVLVFPVRGPCLDSCLGEMSLAAPDVRCGAVAHCFEIPTRRRNCAPGGNVMWDMVPLDSYNTTTKYKYLGRPKKFAMNPHPGLQQAEIVKQMEVPKSLIKENVYLGDFGLTITPGTSVSCKAHFPCEYCAPERFHKIKPSFASDMWSYMCLFAKLYLGFVPFHGLFDDAPSGVVISSMVNALGPLPENWKGDYIFPEAADESWYDQGRQPVSKMTLAAKIKHARPEASQTEISNVLSFMSKVFCYLPESRISAAELLEVASFKAVMQIYQP